MKPMLVCLLVGSILCVASGTAKCGDRPVWDDDLWDVDKTKVPPVIQPKPPNKPILFECPTVLTVRTDQHGGLEISISPCPEKRIPVSYKVRQARDSTALIELIAKPSRQRRPEHFQPPSQDFTLSVIYRESPADTARYHLQRVDNIWQVEIDRDASFVVIDTAAQREE